MTDNRVKLVLASASPRRLGLLEQAGIKPDMLCPIDLKETPKRRELPRRLAGRLAVEKARAALRTELVREMGPNVFVLAADTVVAVGRRIVPKPASMEEAALGLKLLSGRSHRVYSGVCLIAPGGQQSSRIVETKVRFKRLTREDLETYLMSNEWRDKAGGYAVQGRAEAFVRTLNGSWSNVVGLPLYEAVNLLQGAGYPVYFTWLSGAA